MDQYTLSKLSELPANVLTANGLVKCNKTGRFGIRIPLVSSLGGYIKSLRKRGRFTNPIAPNQADVVMWTLYDRNTAAAGATTATEYDFFTVPMGNAGKTKADTNMEQVMRLPDPQVFNATGIGFYFSADMLLLDIQNFLDAYYYEFWVGQKTYSEGPLQVAPSGAGLDGVSTATSQQTYSNGTQILGNHFDLRLPAGLNFVDGGGNAYMTNGLIGVTILQGQQFKVKVLAGTVGIALTADDATPNPGTGLNFMCYLYGILSRAVQ